MYITASICLAVIYIHNKAPSGFINDSNIEIEIFISIQIQNTVK